MPLWAKIDVEMPADHKLRGQPVVTRHLWTCLICEAKKQDDAGTIRGYDCSLLAGSFNLPRKAVADALTYFQAARMVELEIDGTMRLVNFTKRQGDVSVESKRASWRDRQQRHRAASRVTNSTELEEEVDREKERKEEKGSSSFSQDPEIARERQTDATPTEQARIKHALGLDRKAARG